MRGRKSKNKTAIPVVAVLILMIISTLISSLNDYLKPEKTVESYKNSSGDIAVHFLDVGQGDCEFVELPDGKCVLIDAGDSNCGKQIVDYIVQCGYNSIDYVIATHPHADHIGSMSYIVDNLDIGEIYMPKVSSNTKTFERMLTSISDKGLSINSAAAGVQVYSDSNLKMEFVAPVSDSYEDLNNYSAVLRITYGDNSFLFTGDAEDISEDEMIANYYYSLSSDVLKVGHHGSDSSSTEKFLHAVSPEYAVISCGAYNSYGHPHSELLSRIKKVGADIYRTDKQGTVTIICNGKGNFDIRCEVE